MSEECNNPSVIPFSMRKIDISVGTIIDDDDLSILSSLKE